MLAPWKKSNLDSILKSRDITLPTNFRLVKAMIFPVVVYESESWSINKAKSWRIDGFELWCWRRILRVPWTERRSNHSILRVISPEYSLEGLMLKLQYFGHLVRKADSLEKTHFTCFSCCSVAKLCLTLWDPMDYSTPGFPVLHYLPKFAQTNVHWLGDAIQPSHPLSLPSPSSLSLSQHQDLFQWASSSHQMAKVLEFQHQSFQWIFRTDFL